MKIAIPTADYPVESVHGHVATAPYFTVVDLDTGETERVPNPLIEGKPREVNPVGLVRDLGVDALLCGGIGSWAIKLLNAAGIKVYRAHGGPVMRAIREFREGKLRLFTDEGEN